MTPLKTQHRRKRNPAALPKPHHIPHVLLLVDTAGSVGRGFIEGIGRYAAENGPWWIQYEYRALDSLPPKWLKRWKIVQAMTFIRDDACNGIDVPRVADEVGLSRSFLERRFFQYLGRTPNAEIMRMQIERAKMLLAQTDQTVDRITQKCGFTSSEYFSRAFRREAGMTPNAYRRMRRIARDLAPEEKERRKD